MNPYVENDCWALKVMYGHVIVMIYIFFLFHLILFWFVRCSKLIWIWHKFYAASPAPWVLAFACLALQNKIWQLMISERNLHVTFHVCVMCLEDVMCSPVTTFSSIVRLVRWYGLLSFLSFEWNRFFTTEFNLFQRLEYCALGEKGSYRCFAFMQ